jgi:hypothetical protein
MQQSIGQQAERRHCKGLSRIMKTRRSSLAVIAFALCLSAPTLGYAQSTDGRMGSTSRASVQITLSVAPRIGLTRADATTVRNSGSSHGVQNVQPLCIWSNSAIRTYSVTALSDARPSFYVRNAAGEELPYSVEWASADRSKGTPLAHGSALRDLEAADAPQCGAKGDVTAGLIVTMPEQASRGDKGAYTGALLLIIAPQ